MSVSVCSSYRGTHYRKAGDYVFSAEVSAERPPVAGRRDGGFSAGSGCSVRQGGQQHYRVHRHARQFPGQVLGGPGHDEDALCHAFPGGFPALRHGSDSQQAGDRPGLRLELQYRDLPGRPQLQPEHRPNSARRLLPAGAVADHESGQVVQAGRHSHSQAEAARLLERVDEGVVAQPPVEWAARKGGPSFLSVAVLQYAGSFL